MRLAACSNAKSRAKRAKHYNARYWQILLQKSVEGCVER